MWAGIRIIGRGGLSVAEFSPHNSAINSRFQSEFWPIFEHYAIKDPAHSGILRVRGGSSQGKLGAGGCWGYSPRTRR